MPTCDWSVSVILGSDWLVSIILISDWLVSIILGSDWLLHLAEEHGDQEGGASGVGGGRQEEGDPGGHREHRGRDEVDVDVFTERQ